MVRRVCRELGRQKNIIVINDEAHHCHRRKKEVSCRWCIGLLNGATNALTGIGPIGPWLAIEKMEISEPGSRSETQYTNRVALRAAFRIFGRGVPMHDHSQLESLAVFRSRVCCSADSWGQAAVTTVVAISEPRRCVWLGDGSPADGDAILIFEVQSYLLSCLARHPAFPGAARAWGSFYGREVVFRQVVGKALHCHRFTTEQDDLWQDALTAVILACRGWSTIPPGAPWTLG